MTLPIIIPSYFNYISDGVFDPKTAITGKNFID